MNYKVHKLNINLEKEQGILEDFINNLKGEVISIIPYVKPTFQFMGATAKTNFLLVVEKVNDN